MPANTPQPVITSSLTLWHKSHCSCFTEPWSLHLLMHSTVVVWAHPIHIPFKPLTPTDTTQCHCDYTIAITIHLRLSSNKPIFHHGCGGSFKGGSEYGIPALLAYYVSTVDKWMLAVTLIQLLKGQLLIWMSLALMRCWHLTSCPLTPYHVVSISVFY